MTDNIVITARCEVTTQKGNKISVTYRIKDDISLNEKPVREADNTYVISVNNEFSTELINCMMNKIYHRIKGDRVDASGISFKLPNGNTVDVLDDLRIQPWYYEKLYFLCKEQQIHQFVRIEPLSLVHVYLDKCHCISCSKTFRDYNLVSVCALVPIRNSDEYKAINLQMCKTCGNYYIDKNSLDKYKSICGELDLSYDNSIIKRENTLLNSNIRYNPDSILSRNGYSSRLPTNERHRIIEELLMNGVEKWEITEHLSYLISDRGDRFPNARIAWENDLSFVNDFDLYGQEIVKFFR